MKGFFSKKRGALLLGFIVGVLITATIVIIRMMGPRPTFTVAGVEEEDALENTNVEETLVYESEDITVKVTSFYMDDFGGNYILELLIDNNTDKTLYVYTPNSALNHYTIECTLYDNELKPNTSKGLNLEFGKSSIKKYNIKDVGLIEFDLSFENTERFFSTPDIYEYAYHLKVETNQYDNMSETFTYDDGLTVLDQDGILIKLLNPDTAFTNDDLVEIYVENNTDQYHYYYFTYFRNVDAENLLTGGFTIVAYPNSKKLHEIGNFLADTGDVIDLSQPIISNIVVYDYTTIYDEDYKVIKNYEEAHWNEVK